MVIANIPDVHPLTDRRTNSRTDETDGDASEIPKRGIISPSGGLEGWKKTRKNFLSLNTVSTCKFRQDWLGSPTTRDLAIGSPTTRDSAIGSPTTCDTSRVVSSRQ